METDIIKVTVVKETPKAFLLSEGEKEAWFPKSQVSFQRRNIKTGEAVAEIPLWLIEKNNWNE